MSPQGVYAMNLLSTETRGDGKGKRIRQENNEGDCPNHDTADGKVQSTALALKNLKRGGKLSVSMWRTRLLIHSKEGKRAVPAIVRLPVSSEGNIHEFITYSKHRLFILWHSIYSYIIGCQTRIR